MWVFPKMVVPPKHPKMIIFSTVGKSWLLGTTILGNSHDPPCMYYVNYVMLFLIFSFLATLYDDVGGDVVED